MEDPRRQVEEFAQEWAAAEQRGDVGFLEGGLTDEFVGRLIRMPVPGIRAGTEYDLLLVVRNEIGPVSVHPVVARTTLDNVVAFDGIVQGAPGPGEASFATLWSVRRMGRSEGGPSSIGGYAIRTCLMGYLPPRRTV